MKNREDCWDWWKEGRARANELSVATSWPREKGKERIISRVSLLRHVDVRSPTRVYISLSAHRRRLAYASRSDACIVARVPACSHFMARR